MPYVGTISPTMGGGAGGAQWGYSSGGNTWAPRIQWQTTSSGATYCNAASLVR